MFIWLSYDVVALFGFWKSCITQKIFPKKMFGIMFQVFIFSMHRQWCGVLVATLWYNGVNIYILDMCTSNIILPSHKTFNQDIE